MKRTYTLALILLLLMAISGIVLLAQDALDDQGSLNNPFTNDRANACYVGGSLEGSCQAEWKWVCGWGIIRVEYGLLPREVLSETCQSLMPAPAATTTPGQGQSETSGLATSVVTSAPLYTPTNTPTGTFVAPTETPTNTPTSTSTDMPTPTNTPT